MGTGLGYGLRILSWMGRGKLLNYEKKLNFKKKNLLFKVMEKEFNAVFCVNVFLEDF